MGVDMSESHEAMDARAHEATYASFVKGTVYVMGAVLLVLALMAIFLV